MVTAPTSGEPMTEGEWRGTFNQVLYALVYHQYVDDSAADAIAQLMIDRRLLPSGPAMYYQALTQAQLAGNLLGPEAIPTDHDEASLRTFIPLLLRRLDERRPWPEARFVRLPPEDWPWAEARVVATIEASYEAVETGVVHGFEFVYVDGVRNPVMVLRQRTGEVIAIVNSTGPDPADRRTRTLRVLQGDPIEALASFMELSGFAEDMVILASSGTQRESGT